MSVHAKCRVCNHHIEYKGGNSGNSLGNLVCPNGPYKGHPRPFRKMYFKFWLQPDGKTYTGAFRGYQAQPLYSNIEGQLFRLSDDDKTFIQYVPAAEGQKV